ncbi:S-layer homology domain-containing protein [Salibacterium salarium]|uniref:S-layer homology domain-containing protein n=1 Tax=Salibacterium salarium TaxID=284579 RepID=A0A3R9QPS0_9BACI|nr:S-layer homology domain-containing protein [Salibacterium salarium]RSL30612.1 S-layer homology domain-containing protein [Salibacterium salarium]
MIKHKGTKVVLTGALTIGSLLVTAGASYSEEQQIESSASPTYDVSQEDPFSDIDENYWAFTEINWGVGQGLIYGYDDDTFRPSEKATQAQFLAILTRFAGEELDESTSDDHWADVHYDYLEERNFPIVGDATHSERNNPVRRGDIARILGAYLGEDLSENEAIQFLYDSDLSTGRDGDQTIDGFGADDSLNRAQLVTFMYRMAEKGHMDLIGLEDPPSDHEDSNNDDSDNDAGDSEENYDTDDTPTLIDTFKGYASVDETLDDADVRDIESVYEDFQEIAANSSFVASMDGTGTTAMLTNDDVSITAAYHGTDILTSNKKITRAQLKYANNHVKEGYRTLAEAAHIIIPAISEDDYYHIIQESHEKTENFTLKKTESYYQDSTDYLLSIGQVGADGVTGIGITKAKKEGDS